MHLHQQKLEAFVEDRTKQVRKIELHWLSKGASALPSNWLSMLEGEVEVSLSAEHEERAGRAIP